jgi:hypothetical protein
MNDQKADDWQDYKRLRDSGDKLPPWRQALAPHILRRRKELVLELEKQYPHFKEQYNTLIGDK